MLLSHERNIQISQGGPLPGCRKMYLAFKAIHLLGVVLFLGNIIVTAVWKTLADGTREPHTPSA